MRARQYIRSEQRRFQRASRGEAWSVKDLPQYYYHKNFCDMLREVSNRFISLLSNSQTRFIRDYDALPFHAQCAYARIAGRKAQIFRTDQLNYPEITSLPQQFIILKEEGFVREICEDDLSAYFSFLSKADLLSLLEQNIPHEDFKKSWSKSVLVNIALQKLDFDNITIPKNIYVQSHLEPLNFLLFLYFGRIETSLQSKTLKDLGLVSPARPLRKKVKFHSKSEAEARYFYAKALYDLTANLEHGKILIETVQNWPTPNDSQSLEKHGKLLYKLAKLEESASNIETALQLYSLSENPLCQERVIRLRYKRNNKNDRSWVQHRLESIIDNPESDKVLYFAQDFYERKYQKKRTSYATDLLRGSDTLALDEAFRHEPERAVQRYYKSKGFATYRTENKFWLSFFGLLFWDQIFPENTHLGWGLPPSLKTEGFYQRHKSVIEPKLGQLSDIQVTQLALLKTFSKHHETPNSLISWDPHILEAVKALISNASPNAVAQVLRLIAKDFQSLKDGFPDLMVIKNGEARFIEVKAEGDVIRRNQMTRIKQLQSAGLKADILSVAWQVDTNQTYVVVDVETTGGRAGLHRITEIGAVKIQGGEIIDEWSSLINPQRSIPSNITRLTGISEAMVAKAPLFIDISDSFAEFMGDAIFAAHNVNFDYGFISAEYQMIDRKFRHPKICTCSSMRKLYPGCASYSLKNLCREFQIDLTTHHRALCDAKAAAQLLILINEKRLALQNAA